MTSFLIRYPLRCGQLYMVRAPGSLRLISANQRVVFQSQTPRFLLLFMKPLKAAIIFT
jgi:hypothetical protein